jgi:hypothetical protein
MEDKNFVIVIQGPLITSGNSGSGDFVSDFNCLENIKQIVSSTRPYARGFIVATWISEIPVQFEEDVIFLQLDDPGRKVILGQEFTSNEYRQAIGSLQGTKKAIELFDAKYVIKVRTDQFVDLPIMIEHIIKVDKSYTAYKKVGQAGFLYFPNMLSWSPYSVGDFFIGGHAIDVLKFFESQVEFSSHTFGYDFSWFHSDIILRHAYRNLRNHLQLPTELYFPNITPSLRLHLLHYKYPIKFHPGTLALWSLLLQQSVSFFPKSISETMYWRGSKMNFEKHAMGEFYEEWEKAYPDFENWYNELYPAFYLKKNDVSHIHRILHFYPEKLVEIREKRTVFRRHIFRLIRITFSLINGYYPKEIIGPFSKVKRFLSNVRDGLSRK